MHGSHDAAGALRLALCCRSGDTTSACARSGRGDIEVMVRTRWPLPRRRPLPRTMPRKDRAGWKICDVIILGVSLVETPKLVCREIDQNGSMGLSRR